MEFHKGMLKFSIHDYTFSNIAESYLNLQDWVTWAIGEK